MKSPFVFRRWVGAVLAAASLVSVSSRAHAQAAPPGGHDDEAFDVMNLMAAHGFHDLDEERWNLYGQFTYISSWKLPFHAPYTNANGSTNSLSPNAERSYTGSFTLFFGMKLWKGAEMYLVPEVISEVPLSGLHGLGGSIQNFELQKTGSSTPQLYRSRTYLRQTINLGGSKIEKTSDPMQLATKVDSRRVVLTAGNFTILDLFDRSTVNWDPRQTFLNMAFMTHSSWDFTSDARGYSWGGVAELYWERWSARFGRMAPPKNPNQLETDFRLDEHYGDDLEIQHDHTAFGQDGSVKILGYRNRVVTGNFDEAIAAFRANPNKNAANCTNAGLFNYDSQNGAAPDLCWVRKPTIKLGIGVTLEQHVTPDIGVFFRAMYSDGQSEVDAYNPADRSISVGAVAKGTSWHRPFDVTGIGYGASYISHAHAEYLSMGGVDGFVGDGHLSQAAETIFELFYSFNLLRAIWLTADYQHIANPGFNADRGPVDIFGGRVHAEF